MFVICVVFWSVSRVLHFVLCVVFRFGLTVCSQCIACFDFVLFSVSYLFSCLVCASVCGVVRFARLG